MKDELIVGVKLGLVLTLANVVGLVLGFLPLGLIFLMPNWLAFWYILAWFVYFLTFSTYVVGLFSMKFKGWIFG